MISASRAISAGKWRSSMPRKFGQRDVAGAIRFARRRLISASISAHLLVGDDEKLPLPQAGSKRGMRAMRFLRFSSLALLSPAPPARRAGRRTGGFST